MHPLKEILEWLPELDFAVLAHGFAPHGRDYVFIIEDCLVHNQGQHELVFTHCMKFEYETRVSAELWPVSWTDEFLDYTKWQEAGEPDGYVWGTNWSNAYPGIEIIEDSSVATEWAKKIGKPMYEFAIETDRFFMRIVFHSIRHRKLNDDTSTISKVTIQLK